MSQTVMNPTFLVVLFILISSVLRGGKNGLVRTVFILFTTIIALGVASAGAPELSLAVRNSKTVQEFFGLEEGKDIDVIKDSAKEIKDGKAPTEAIQEQFVKATKQKAADIIINILSYIILYYLVKLLLWQFGHSLDDITELPVIHTINKGGGMLLGLAYGVVIIWLLGVFVLLLNATDFGQIVLGHVHENMFLMLLMKTNYFAKFLRLDALL
ncbi:MAG: CvpA family protein [Lachnospiraceae bacterium]|nr:CvpA family protein [Lachnospiraceae bacterium]